jgi:HTH-type transcriptional regulator / antitoxin HigA
MNCSTALNCCRMKLITLKSWADWEDYENQHVHIPEVRGVRALQHLMEENGLKQSDLAHLFGGKSAISEVLRGNRALSKSQIVRLRDYFGVPADTFIG